MYEKPHRNGSFHTYLPLPPVGQSSPRRRRFHWKQESIPGSLRYAARIAVLGLEASTSCRTHTYPFLLHVNYEHCIDELRRFPLVSGEHPKYSLSLNKLVLHLEGEVQSDHLLS